MNIQSENPSKRPGASPRRKSKSHSIRASRMRSKILTCHCLTSSNQKGVISGTVCGWHVRILLRILLARILWDFDFLRGLAPGRLDGFSIGRYEKNRKSFDLYAVKFEIGAMLFLGEKSLRRWNPFKTSFPPFSLFYYARVNVQRRTLQMAKIAVFNLRNDNTQHLR